MTKNSPALNGTAALVADFAQAKQYWQAARVAAGQSAAFMILMGAELERLFKIHGKSHGGARNGSSFQAESLKWADVVQKQVGCSEAQAWRAREMFKASRKRVPLLNGPELLSTSIADLPVKRQEDMLRAVAKVTDGKTSAEIMRDFGIGKKEQGSAAKGGNTRKPAKEAAGDEEGSGESTTSASEASESKIPAGVDPSAWKLNQFLEEALLDNCWNDCTEAFRRTLHGNLVDATARLAATLKKGAAS